MEINNFNLYKTKWNIESETIIKPGLEAIQKALAKLDNPQNKHRIIHVAGTNGKGSTIAFLSAIAKENGFTYGSFTSPSIIDVHDQIQLNGVHVTPEKMDYAFQKISRAGLSGMLTDFELLTVVAFLVFEGEVLDVVFLEAGMGGRFDSTNVIESSVAVIPSLSLDHTNFLGDTIQKISWHKAGIIKENSKLVIGEFCYEARKIVLNEAEQRNSVVIENNIAFSIKENTYTYGVTQFYNLHPQMLGGHQLSNMSLAITALLESELSLKECYVQAAVKKASLPGRMEKVSESIYFDGAHNKASIDALVDTLKEQFPNKRIHFIVGILKDKEFKYMLRKLEEVASSFEFVDFHHERAQLASILYKHCNHGVKRITKEVSDIKLEENSEADVTIVTGSFYFISEIKVKNR